MTAHTVVLAFGYLAWGVIATAAITCSVYVLGDAVRTEWRRTTRRRHRNRTIARDRHELAQRRAALNATGTVTPIHRSTP